MLLLSLLFGRASRVTHTLVPRNSIEMRLHKKRVLLAAGMGAPFFVFGVRVKPIMLL